MSGNAIETAWHGFQNFVAFCKAMFWLVGAVGSVLYFAGSYAFDSKYAGKQAVEVISNQVATNSHTALAVQSTLILMLREDIDSAKVEHCKASTPDSKRYRNRRLTDLVENYRETTGEEPHVPRCEDLL